VNCIGYLEDGSRFEVGVGSGFKDHERDDMRDNPEAYLNGAVTIEIKYQEISKLKGREAVSLRFPTKHRFRGRDDKIVNIEE
jgi:ATP-dependent DNA ligase